MPHQDEVRAPFEALPVEQGLPVAREFRAAATDVHFLADATLSPPGRGRVDTRDAGGPASTPRRSSPKNDDRKPYYGALKSGTAVGILWRSAIPADASGGLAVRGGERIGSLVKGLLPVAYSGGVHTMPARRLVGDVGTPD